MPEGLMDYLDWSGVGLTIYVYMPLPQVVGVIDTWLKTNKCTSTITQATMLAAGPTKKLT